MAVLEELNGGPAKASTRKQGQVIFPVEEKWEDKVTGIKQETGI